MAKYFRSEAAELVQGLSASTEAVVVWADVSGPDPAKVFGPAMARQGGQNHQLFEECPPPGGDASMILYGTAKVGIVGLTAPLARVLAPHVHVNALLLLSMAGWESGALHRQWRERHKTEDAVGPRAGGGAQGWGMTRDASAGSSSIGASSTPSIDGRTGSPSSSSGPS